jgi:PAS domain S-box-containing protein
VFNTTLEYIGLLSTDGKLHDANRASLEFSDIAYEEVIGKYFWETPWFAGTPGMPEWVKAAVERAAAGEPSRKEMALVRPSGDVVHFDFSLTPVFNEDGKVIWLVPEGRDISDMKRAEQALLQSEKLAAVGRLAASIAHEINNPLEAVTNLLYLARESRSLEQIADCLKTADHELRRVSTIANQTLRFHKQAANPQPVSAADLVGTVLSIYEGRLRNSNIAVKLSYRTEQPVMCFDGDIRQVLNNLVGNSIDAMSRRGGELIVRSHATHDWKTGRAGIVITIADTGAGIAKENLRRIFEPFFTTKGIGGTGLGLWICQEVATRHQGTLRVRSSDALERSGTVFRFFLPFEQAKTPAMHGAEK